MPRIQQGHGVKGSQKWIQKLVNEKPDLLNSLIKIQLNLSDTDTITWLSPLAEDGYSEYQDQASQNIPFRFLAFKRTGLGWAG